MSLMKTKRTRSLSMILTMIFSAFIFSTAVRSAEPESSLMLFQAIDERLAHMEDVALFKAQNQMPVEDLASSHGLDPDSMERFFIAQISAAKAIQYRYRAALLTREIPTRLVDLQAGIRPALDRLGNDIIVLFATVLHSRSAMEEQSRERFMNTLQSQLLADAEREAMFDAMLEVRRSQ